MSFNRNVSYGKQMQTLVPPIAEQRFQDEERDFGNMLSKSFFDCYNDSDFEDLKELLKKYCAPNAIQVHLYDGENPCGPNRFDIKTLDGIVEMFRAWFQSSPDVIFKMEKTCILTDPTNRACTIVESDYNCSFTKALDYISPKYDSSGQGKFNSSDNHHTSNTVDAAQCGQVVSNIVTPTNSSTSGDSVKTTCTTCVPAMLLKEPNLYQAKAYRHAEIATSGVSKSSVNNGNRNFIPPAIVIPPRGWTPHQRFNIGVITPRVPPSQQLPTPPVAAAAAAELTVEEIIANCVRKRKRQAEDTTIATGITAKSGSMSSSTTVALTQGITVPAEPVSQNGSSVFAPTTQQEQHPPYSDQASMYQQGHPLHHPSFHHGHQDSHTVQGHSLLPPSSLYSAPSLGAAVDHGDSEWDALLRTFAQDDGAAFGGGDTTHSSSHRNVGDSEKSLMLNTHQRVVHLLEPPPLPSPQPQQVVQATSVDSLYRLAKNTHYIFNGKYRIYLNSSKKIAKFEFLFKLQSALPLPPVLKK